MKGGYQILDLRNIGISYSSETKNITDPEILDQLRNLREYIEKGHNYSSALNNSLKCVMIRYRDAKVSEKWEECEFATINSSNASLTYEIKGKELRIEVVFEEKEDDDGNPYYDIKTAKYLYNQNVIIGGDLEVVGETNLKDDLKINGESVFGEWNGTLENTTYGSLIPTGLFCKAVRNFKELQFILNVRLTNNTESNITITSDKRLCKFENIPSEIRNKIYNHLGIAGGDGSIAYCNLFVSNTQGTSDNSQMPRYANLYGYSSPDYLTFYFEGGNIVIPAGESRDFEARISLAI